MEGLESRQLLSTVARPIAPRSQPVILLRAGQPRYFRDADGSLVGVVLRGPGTGSITLANGHRTGAAIETISLTGTTSQSRLIVTSHGGRVKGTSLLRLQITGAEDATAVLKSFEGRQIDLATDGVIVASASVGTLSLRNVANHASIQVDGDLSRVVAGSIGANLSLRVSGQLGSFQAGEVGSGAFFATGGIGSWTVKGPLGRRSQILAGAGGINELTVGGLETSQIVAMGPIGNVVVTGNMTASSIASKVDAGFDGEFGTDDDLLVHGASVGAIGTVRVDGVLQGAADPSRTFGIVTFGTIGSVAVAGQVITVNGRGQSADGRVKIIPGPPLGVDPPTGPEFAIADYMGWGSTAPHFANNVAYASSGQWETLNVINYTPSHYARTNSAGVLVDNNNAPLVDTSFQAQIGTDFPTASTRYSQMSYLLGNPEIMMEHDFRQLQAAGFDGVRLYEVAPKDYVAAIEIAYRMSTEAQSKGAFHVYYEVATPDLSVEPYIGTTGKTVDERIQNLYETLTSAGDPAGSFQVLHYVINTVTPEVFAQVVPLVFFGHENLVSPTTLPENTVLDDNNTSTPLLRWGINATRKILDTELNVAGATLPRPAVTNALLAGLVVQVSTYVHPVVESLVQVIQVDANSPIAYDNYSFQWGNNYFNTASPYRNDNDPHIIANAYPVDPVTGEIKYVDKTMSQGSEWTSGPPPVAPTYTPADTVTKADLFWSLEWITDRVDWIWGHLQGKPGGKTKQLIAETGWATDQLYAPNNGDGSPGKQITGDLDLAKAYYEAIAALDFHIDGVPVMYFDAYDEPAKNDNPLMLSENHYGIFRWTGLPKWGDAGETLPLADPKGFTFLGMVPSNYSDAGVISTPMRFKDSKATDSSYSYSVNGGPPVAVPWFHGGNVNSDGKPSGQLFIPNPDVLLRDQDVLTITSAAPGDLQAFIKLKYDAAGNTVSFVNPKPAWNPVLAPPDGGALGSDWKINFTFPWLHDNSNDYGNTQRFPRVFADFWAKPRS